MLNLEDLETGAIYAVAARNFSIAIWTGESFKGPGVEYKKLKFLIEEPYWVGLPFGTCTPLKKLSTENLRPPFDGINLLRALKALNDQTEEIKSLTVWTNVDRVTEEPDDHTWS